MGGSHHNAALVLVSPLVLLEEHQLPASDTWALSVGGGGGGGGGGERNGVCVQGPSRSRLWLTCG